MGAAGDEDHFLKRPIRFSKCVACVAELEVMLENRLFYCLPQQAFLSTNDCQKLRKRPTSKSPGSGQTKLVACEKCTMYKLVDGGKVPTISLTDYMDGKRPDIVSQDLVDSVAA